MLSESEQSAARLAVSLYHADPERVLRTVRDVLRAKARGEAVDLLQVLEKEQILTAEQVKQLRQNLDQTQLDLTLSGAGSRLSSPTPDPTRSPGQSTPVPPSRISLEPDAIKHYRILRRLGVGGMGSVYLGFDKTANRNVAIKILAPEHAVIPKFLDRFHREGQNGVLLNHPNIVHGFEFDRDEKTKLHYLVLEYVDGPCALDLIERFGPLPVGVAVRIIVDIARGLAHAHAHAIIHRDIKPGNILLTTTGIAKLSDLGLAKKTDEASHLTSARQGVGTPYYVPYEQALNAKKADERSDIYALGATLYHLLTGEVPFPGETSLEIVERQAKGSYVPASLINPAVPEAVEKIMARMLAFLPEDRYPGTEQLLKDLEGSSLAAPASEVADFIRALQATPTPERASSSQLPTSPDLRLSPLGPAASPSQEQPTWYLRYLDAHGHLCEVVLSLAEIARRLHDAEITADRAQVSRSPHSGFQPLASVPEVRQALAALLAERGISGSPSLFDTMPRAWFFDWRIGVCAVLVLLFLIALFWMIL